MQSHKKIFTHPEIHHPPNPRSAIPSIASIASIALYSLYSPPPGFATHDAVRQAIGAVFFGEADFFSAKRLFFRAARDVSGERSAPPWAASGDIMAKTRFRLYPHSPAHERASALTSPPPDFLFSSIPQSHHPTIPQTPLSHPKTRNIPIGIAFCERHH